MAEIFLARSVGLDGFEKELVIKRIRPELCNDRVFSSHFVDEARISISLSHQNIVQVFDFGHEEGSYFLAMEYVHGCDLARLLALDGILGRGLDPGLALFVGQEMCRGLDYAHRRKGRDGEPLSIVHRDISPHNILLSEGGAVKVADFGIARAAGRLSQTHPGMVLGKLSYMAPEQLMGNPVDHRTDIFSAGIVLWEALVGQRVYEGLDGAEIVQRLRDAAVPPPSQQNQSLPPEIDTLLGQALAPNPEERFANARAFGQAIHATMKAIDCHVSSFELMSLMEKHWGELEVVDFEHIDAGEPTRNIDELLLTESEPSPAVVDLSPSALAGAVCERLDFLRLVDEFAERPSLWTLLEMADSCIADGAKDAAAAILRAAAVTFAQRGMLAQALLCSQHLLQLRPFAEVRAEIAALPSLVGRPASEIEPALYRGDGPAEALLRSLLAPTPSHGGTGQATPLLNGLSGRAFAELAAAAPVRRFGPTELVVRQGDAGRTMYLIARGRVVVYADDAKGVRTYLSSLIAGDFFGENGFFSGAPRNASVAAHEPTEVFEIDHDVFERVMGESFAAARALLEFYKERLVDNLLVRSPVFALLSPSDRRAVIDKFDFATFPAGALVIREGDESDDIFLIKSGEAEVHSEQGGRRTILATLGPASIFGEFAALGKIPRTASVTARSELQTLRIAGSAFLALLEDQRDVRRRVLAAVAERTRGNISKLGPRQPR